MLNNKALAKLKAMGGGSGGGGGSGDSGGGAVSVAEKDVNFYDYDGTCLHSYTVAEAQALTELPPLPEQKGLVCQGWNWSLEDIKAHNRAINVGAMYITDDGKTRIYIHLEEGRTSPVLGVCPNGTVTVDWGDGTEPDVLTGTSTGTVKWTPTHDYASAGDYVVTLSVDGKMGLGGLSSSALGSYILRHSSSSDAKNKLYQNSVRKMEIGDGVTSISGYSFYNCYALKSVTIPNGVTSINDRVFIECYALKSVIIPKGVTSISGYSFYNCYALKSVTIPNGVTSINDYAFYNCYALKSVTIPDGVKSISGYSFCNCYALKSVTIPYGVTKIAGFTLSNCCSLTIVIIPKSVGSIDANAFISCSGVRYYDFTSHTSVPTLSNTNAFQSIASDCEIRVPAALCDEWIAATNWATYASQIVAV